MTPNDFLKIILKAENKCTDPIPKGWYSCAELGKIWNLKKTASRMKILKGIELGLIETKNFSIKDRNGKLHFTPHYFFKNEKKSSKSKN